VVLAIDPKDTAITAISAAAVILFVLWAWRGPKKAKG
jgi:hypothetical protein